MAFSFTEAQKRAIGTRGRSLLVSAAAGSGKTRVLTERVMAYVTDPDEQTDIDRFLIITYTRAAAGEMRSRIMDSLAAAAAADPGNRHLRRQQDRCWQAQIGTIHSFCTTLLRENCHHIGLPPAFRVMDEDRAVKMKESVLEKLLESRYERMDAHPGFRELADSVGAGRDDRRLAETVLRIYEKIRSHPYPELWAKEQAEQLDSLAELDDIASTVWGQIMLDDIASSARYWSERMDEAVLEIHNADDKIIAAYGGVFIDDAAALRDFVRALGEGWDRAREFLPPEQFASLGRLTKYEDVAFKDRMKSIRDNYKKAAEGFRKAMAEPSAKQLHDLQATAPAMKALLALCTDFDRAFSAEKRRESLVDFSDLEHMALELLVDRDTGKATWIAVELSQRYREIMVDEYQDVNAVQDMIFRALSREGRNLFMVGDVKQSIYRFRLADPTIFLDKYESYGDFDPDSEEAQRILLQENFRSRRSILDAANLVFSNIMSRELGELDYDEDAALRFGAPDYPEGSDTVPELCIIDPASDNDEETPEKTALEARYVARRIREMMDAATPVYEKGGVRKCRWSDFALLMRSPGGKGSIFHEELAKAGIPVRSQQAGGFFSSLEVGVAIDMLAVIDNPHADVPLISVLRSPAFGFTADELAAIRAADKRSDFYSALLAAAEGGSSRCRDFRDRLDAIRAAAPDMSLDALLWRVYTETGLFAICSAMSGGEERRANLMGLFELARNFEESGYRGLFRFVAWLRRMAERGQEPMRASEGDFVSIMSIHKSKGLEFPFVFLCDLAHQFNTNDSKENVLVHSSLGLGSKLTDTARGVEYPTLSRRAIEKQLQKERLSEEMRVLYVAMTRAREKLIMTAAWKNAGAKLYKLRDSLQSPMPPALLRSAQSFLPWIASAALIGGEELIKTNIVYADAVDAPEAQAEAAPEARPAAKADEALVELLRSRLGFRYPHAGAVELPTKLSATELSRYDAD
ncbi:MAG: helicase-exonuclease AddAB subunit AddA, partial [Oscillospiraceae bacterium]|nr:helicase-exonuclease AddAB subunit AddA [Oscillospiraceae bacterium]